MKLYDKPYTMSDEVLLSHMREGEERAFNTLFVKYYPTLCAYARQYVEPQEGEEIVQDMMAWLWENRKRVVVESSLKSYLFCSVRNRCYTLINRKELDLRVSNIFYGRQPEFEDPDFYIIEELEGRIKEAILRLPESYREAFEMNRFQNMTYGQIAERIGVSSKTIDYRIQQALKQLRADLKDYLPLIFFIL